MIADYKAGLRKAGVKALQGVVPAPVGESREYRKVPEERLEARLGLAKYNADAPLLADDWWKKDGHIRKVKILLGQHIGAPAIPVVEKGAQVKVGDCIARPAEGLSVGIHASLDGVVQEVTDGFVIIAER